MQLNKQVETTFRKAVMYIKRPNLIRRFLTKSKLSNQLHLFIFICKLWRTSMDDSRYAAKELEASQRDQPTMEIITESSTINQICKKPSIYQRMVFIHYSILSDKNLYAYVFILTSTSLLHLPINNNIFLRGDILKHGKNCNKTETYENILYDCLIK